MQNVVQNLATGLREIGLDEGDRVGLFADTRMEWAQADLATLAAGGVVTTVYTESSPRQVQYLLGDPDADAVVVENEALLDRIVEVEDELDLEFIVVIDETDAYENRMDVFSLADVYERGDYAFDPDEYRSWLDARDPEDLASLIYTSGTTGQPKGVQLSHANFRANITGVRKRFGPRPDKSRDVPVLDEAARSLSFLPLAHVFERTAGHFVMFAAGGTVAYAESADTDSPGLSLRLKYGLADRLVFSQVKEQMGGNIDFFISGGGSLNRRLSELFEGMGLPILEGYGLTETAPVVSSNPPEDPRAGTLGPELVNVDIKLDSSVVTTEQAQRAAPDSRIGELLVKGPIEDAFATSDRIGQAMVVGDNEKFVSALFVPEFEKYERIKEFRLVPVEWTPENDLLTPSMKIKRRNVLDRFSEQYDEIYGTREARAAADD